MPVLLKALRFFVSQIRRLLYELERMRTGVSFRRFEFIIPDRPVSQQTRRRDRLRDWQTYVRDLARTAFGGQTQFSHSAIAVRLLYIYEEAALDADNVVKPIQDALVSVVFPDDSSVSDVEVRRRWLGENFVLADVSPTLASGLSLGHEFIHVVVEQAPPQDVLP